LSIFLLGAMAGAFALNAFNLYFGSKAPMTREARFEKLSNELGLSPVQQTDVKQIFGETRERAQAIRKEDEPKMNAIREEADGKLQKILDPEQWEKFVKMRDAKRDEEKQRNSNK
jgi:hypothetical protein